MKSCLIQVLASFVLVGLAEGCLNSRSGKLEDWDGSDAIFTNQKVVFHITSTADIGNNNDAAKKSGFQMGVGVLPIPTGTKRNGVVIGGASLWIPKAIAKQDGYTAASSRKRYQLIHRYDV